eukprot:8491256-Pyramimonas_sp.AAC.1
MGHGLGDVRGRALEIMFPRAANGRIRRIVWAYDAARRCEPDSSVCSPWPIMMPLWLGPSWMCDAPASCPGGDWKGAPALL